MIRVCYTWGNCPVLWKDANWTWNECQLIEEIVSGIPEGGIPGEFAQPPWLQDEPTTHLDREKKKRFIRLLAKIKGEPEFNEQKEVKTNIKISMKDIKLVIKAVKGIDVEIYEE